MFSERDPQLPHLVAQGVWVHTEKLTGSARAVDLATGHAQDPADVTCEQTEVVTMLRRHGLETDLAIHIHHPEAPGADVPSRLGLQLVSSLAIFGLVEHSVWEEMT